MSTTVTYIGHSTVLIQMDGLTVLTDPLLENRVAHLLRRKPLPAIDLSSIDLVLVSHLHLDHFHPASLRRVGKNKPLICPAGSERNFARNGFTDIRPLHVGEALEISDVRIQAVRAEHHHGILPCLPGAPCLGYVLEGSDKVYFAGDTDVYPEMAAFRDRLDLALLPVWGWGPSLGSGHMDPYRAALALTYLKSKTAIPIHWGTYYPIGLGWLRPHLLIDPPQLFHKFAKGMAPKTTVRILEVGDSISL